MGTTAAGVCVRDAGGGAPAGPPVLVRGYVPGDLERLEALWSRLSPRARALRWLAPLRPEIIARLWRQRERAGVATIALLAEAEAEPREVVGVVEVAGWGAEIPDIAVVVRDDWQRRGIGRALVREAVGIARGRAIPRLSVTLLPENEAARRLLHGAGVPFSAVRAGSEIVAVLELGRGC